MKPSVIVWDLETVPDLSGFATANDLVGKTEADIRAVLGSKFPKHIYHTIVCIGALVTHRERDLWEVTALGAPHVGERTEKQLISAFCEKIAELTPQLVTFNGNTFDLPVLRYRAMMASRLPDWRFGPTSTDTPRTQSTCATFSPRLLLIPKPP
jgi:predicted PolB exonuclease-like 3'-5' exonuclease